MVTGRGEAVSGAEAQGSRHACPVTRPCGEMPVRLSLSGARCHGKRSARIAPEDPRHSLACPLGSGVPRVGGSLLDAGFIRSFLREMLVTFVRDCNLPNHAAAGGVPGGDITVNMAIVPMYAVFPLGILGIVLLILGLVIRQPVAKQGK